MYHVDQLENLITQYMKMHGVPTYSLCEGMYIVDKLNYTIDSVNYMNFETDNLLVWGQSVIDAFELEGIPRKRMRLAGYPHSTIAKPITANCEFRNCLVLLARRDFHETDMNLLRILSKDVRDCRYCLKLHPNLNRKEIEDFACAHNMVVVPENKLVSECLSEGEYDWAIAVNTTAYYEALIKGLPCFRFCDGKFVLGPGLKDDFSTIDELLALQGDISERIRAGRYQEEVMHMLRYAIGYGINNYREILL